MRIRPRLPAINHILIINGGLVNWILWLAGLTRAPRLL
jgi:hypothetical protein